MGQGDVDWDAYFALWREVCPQAPVQLEIISQWGKTIPAKSDEKFWKQYQDVRAVDYAAFKRWAVVGKPRPDAPEDRHTKEFMEQDLNVSLTYCRERLGLGLQG